MGQNRPPPKKSRFKKDLQSCQIRDGIIQVESDENIWNYFITAFSLFHFFSFPLLHSLLFCLAILTWLLSLLGLSCPSQISNWVFLAEARLARCLESWELQGGEMRAQPDQSSWLLALTPEESPSRAMECPLQHGQGQWTWFHGQWQYQSEWSCGRWGGKGHNYGDLRFLRQQFCAILCHICNGSLPAAPSQGRNSVV